MISKSRTRFFEVSDSSYSSESIHINLSDEETEMQELRLQLDGTHEGDCKKPGETVTLLPTFLIESSTVLTFKTKLDILWNCIRFDYL